MPLSTSSVCFPVVRKHWLLYAWQLGKPDSAVKQQDLDGLRGWIRNAPQKAITAAQAQWRGLKEAQEGSIKNYVYKIAQTLLSREDPTEAFFKQLSDAHECSEVRLVYPANFQEAYVRRALRVVAKQRAAYHQRRYRFALAGMLPLCPLMVSPLPNLPLYYLGYRVYSHNTAHVGARATLQLLDAHSARSKDKLRDAIEELRKEGHAPRDGSWAAELVASGGDESAANAEKASQSAKLVLEGNDELASLTDPGRNRNETLSDEAMQAIADAFQQPAVRAAAVKARARAEKAIAKRLSS